MGRPIKFFVNNIPTGTLLKDIEVVFLGQHVVEDLFIQTG